MFSLAELLATVPTSLEERTPGRHISKARSLMTPEELAEWERKYRAERRAYDAEYRKRIRERKQNKGETK